MGAPGHAHDLSRFDTGHIGPCVGGLLLICCPVSTRSKRRGRAAVGGDRTPASRSLSALTAPLSRSRSASAVMTRAGRQAGELLEAGAHREAVRSARWAAPVDRLAITPPSAYDSARIPRRGGGGLIRPDV